ncbi:hypothetical protein BJ138DRAFT_1105525, partial [Hygrophoropsis aurantiaca]
MGDKPSAQLRGARRRDPSPSKTAGWRMASSEAPGVRAGVSGVVGGVVYAELKEAWLRKGWIWGRRMTLTYAWVVFDELEPVAVVAENPFGVWTVKIGKAASNRNISNAEEPHARYPKVVLLEAVQRVDGADDNWKERREVWSELRTGFLCSLSPASWSWASASSDARLLFAVGADGPGSLLSLRYFRLITGPEIQRWRRHGFQCIAVRSVSHSAMISYVTSACKKRRAGDLHGSQDQSRRMREKRRADSRHGYLERGDANLDVVTQALIRPGLVSTTFFAYLSAHLRSTSLGPRVIEVIVLVGNEGVSRFRQTHTIRLSLKCQKESRVELDLRGILRYHFLHTVHRFRHMEYTTTLWTAITTPYKINETGEKLHTAWGDPNRETVTGLIMGTACEKAMLINVPIRPDHTVAVDYWLPLTRG